MCSVYPGGDCRARTNFLLQTLLRGGEGLHLAREMEVIESGRLDTAVNLAQRALTVRRPVLLLEP